MDAAEVPQLIESYRWPNGRKREQLQLLLIKILNVMEDFRTVVHWPRATGADKAQALANLLNSAHQVFNEHGPLFARPTADAVQRRMMNVALGLM